MPAAKLEILRKQFPVLSKVAYLNTGTAGPLAEKTVQAMAQAAERELYDGRGIPGGHQQFLPVKASVRQRIQRLLNAPDDSIALTQHTTHGINIVLWGLHWEPGDEVITTTLEHQAAAVPLALLRQRQRVVVRFADVGFGDHEKTLTALERAFTKRTRLVALSHIVYSSGAVLPLSEIIEMAHHHGVPVLADGAQSVGVLPIDVQALDVDFYTISGQKWLCGPEGTGALYVRPDRVDDLLPTFGGSATTISQDYRGFILPAHGAQRYEFANVYRPGTVGLDTALSWLDEEVEWSWAHERIPILAAYCRQRLQEIPAVKIITPPKQQGGLVNFDLLQWSPLAQTKLVSNLAKKGVIIRNIPHPPYCLRASTGWFNTETEIDWFCEALREAIKAGPESILAA